MRVGNDFWIFSTITFVTALPLFEHIETHCQTCRCIELPFAAKNTIHKNENCSCISSGERYWKLCWKCLWNWGPTPLTRVAYNFPSVEYPWLFLLMEVWRFIWSNFHEKRWEILKTHRAPHILTLQRESRKNEKYWMKIFKFWTLTWSFRDI